MSAFWLYLQIGIEHILDPKGIDHMLFIVTLCAIYQFSEWKKVLILVTAFTIGHSLTLALSALEIVLINQDFIEMLIPITIFSTAVLNIIAKKDTRHRLLQYGIALGFGLIHGLGFSNYFKALLMNAEDIISPLFFFNLGIEIGQLVIILAFGILLYLFTRIGKVKHQSWKLYLSGGAAAISLLMIIEKVIS